MDDNAVKATRGGPLSFLRGLYTTSTRKLRTRSLSAGRSQYRYHALPSEPEPGDMEGSTANLAQESDVLTLPLGPPPAGKYGDASWGDVVHLTTVLVRIPFVSAWLFAKNLIHNRTTLKRSTAISLIRWLNAKMTYQQIQYATPQSVDAYKLWAKKQKMPVTVEDLIDDTPLMWIGPKRKDKVVLYIPGGAYLFPLRGDFISFWRYVQLELAKENCDVGFVILGYSLVPAVGFPTQLRQATVAVEHLIATGVHPSNLHIVGDSAGAHLILSLLSHILHPLPGLRPIVPLVAPIKGVYLMSPWVVMRSTSASTRSNAAYDIIPVPDPTRVSYADLVQRYAANEHEVPYIDPLNAQDSWFSGLDGVVERVLMTAGGREMLRDDIISFSQTLSKVKSSRNFTFEVQEGGVHNDPYIDFMIGLPHDQLGSLTPLIIHWLAGGIKPR